MQTWAKRGLQTALVTGGLLMLGTGIASADEDVNPDKPASPLDGSLTAPVHIDNNAIGSPLGQKNLPGINQEVGVSPSDVLGSVPLADRAEPVTPLVAQAQTAAPVTDALAPVTDQTASLTGRAAQLDAVSGLNGNTVNGDVVVPADISGNAVAVLGQAEVENESHQSYDNTEDLTTSGTGGFIAGNAVDLDYVLPIQVAGNAIAAVGRAESTNKSSQDVTTGGDLVTNGDHGFASGTAGAVHGATPVQVTGNAAAGGGRAATDNEASTSAHSGGSVLTSGKGGGASGTAGAVPVAVPVELNGNGVAGLGGADAMSGAPLLTRAATSSSTTTQATAGDTRTGLYNVPTYVETNGEESLLSGTVAQPAASGPVTVCGNAAAGVGEADATTECATETDAGGTNRSSGAESAGSGSIAHAPVALPGEVFGNPVAVVGTADALTDNQVDAVAGGDSYTRGHDSLAGGTTAVPSLAGPADVFANPIAGAGDADAEVTHDAVTEAGGNTGTTGDNSAGGGNMGTVPVALPGELYGNTAAAVGGAESTVTETKTSTAGGGSNTSDPNGLGASNLATVPVASAAQAFGNGAGVVAFTDTEAHNDAEVTAGGPARGTGTAGVLSGNIVQGAGAVPFQAFGAGASGLAHGEQEAINEIDLTAGGDATTDGTDGAGSGNVANVPVAGAGQLYGDSVAALGLNETEASSATNTTAGGDTDTSGESGFVAGNVASPQALGLAQGFGDAVSGVGGFNSALADNETTAISGGDIDTNGDGGFISGNLVDVPAAAVAQPFGDAVSAIESASLGSGFSETVGQVGGTSTTSGEFGSLSGIDGTLPAGANLPIYNVPVEVLAQAITDSANMSDITVGEDQPQLDLPVSGGIAPTELPSLLPQQQRSMPTDDFAGAFTGVLDGFASGMTGLPGQEMISDVSGSAGPLTDAPGEFHILPAPYPMDRNLPVNGGLLDPVMDIVGGLLGGGGSPLGGLPVMGGQRSDLPLLGGLLGGLPVAGGLTGGLPVVGGLTGGLPMAGGLGARDLPAFPPVFGDLADVTELAAVPAVRSVPEVPAVGDLTDVTTVIPAVPATGDLTDVTTVIPAVPATGDLTDVTTVIPAVPATGDLTDVTTVIPAVPATGDLTDVTTVMPTVPGVPSVPAVGDLTTVQAPSLGTLPVAVPEVSGIQAPGISNGVPAIDDSSLDATRAALANLFAQHPIG